MTYDEAIAKAKYGTPVIRSHWCWVRLMYSPHNNMLFVECDDGERKAYRPNADDKSATDWCVSPFRR